MDKPESFDPQTGKTVGLEEKSKNKTGLIIGIVLLILLLVAGSALGIYLLISCNGKVQVLRAFSNTYNEFIESNALISNMDIEKLIENKDYTLSVDMDTEIAFLGDASITADVSVTKDILQINGDVSLSYIPSMNYLIQMDDEKIRMNTPLFNKYVFIYDYHEDNSGYISNYANTETLNSVLSQMYEALSGEKTKLEKSVEFANSVKEEFSTIKISSAKGEVFTIDGKEVKCKGYSFLVNSQNTVNILNAYEEASKENIWTFLEDMNIDIDKLQEESMDCTVYLYKNELAAIKLIYCDNEYFLNFSGGNYRAQNFKLTMNDIVIYEQSGEISDDGKESMTLSTKEKRVKYSYDIEEGDLTLLIDKYSIDMNIQRNKDELKIKVDYFDLGDTYFGGKLLLKKGTQIQEMSGEEFDIGMADEDVIQNLIEELYVTVMGLVGF